MRRALFGALAASLLAAGVVAGSATAQASPSGVRDVDWHNLEFTVPPVGSCPWQSVRFTDGAGEAGDRVYRYQPGKDVVFADVTGEGVEDALILMQCGPRDSEYSTALIAMTTSADGAAVLALGTVSNPGVWTQQPSDFTVWYGDIAVAVTDFDTEQVWTEYYRWASSAKAFVRVDGS
ncbi:hypothetical protein HUO13_30635 [Saccharopolyspora erythraea]|uniref:hypothetical protein n=1 Tax=Saccharopolyspora erythraea TaxID=1836 RepID=UPI001BABAB2D|nr:hypothetical protein [Saccharopolyspora erythraea]QUH04557.1 hypothetical protein HUO13_30635 [Saccharopolyspora erythraea]